MCVCPLAVASVHTPWAPTVVYTQDHPELEACVAEFVALVNEHRSTFNAQRDVRFSCLTHVTLVAFSCMVCVVRPEPDGCLRE